jgi:hypothetical protein
MNIYKSWVDLKLEIINKPRLVWYSRDSFYYIEYCGLETTIKIESPASVDQQDFENNYKLLGNKPLLINEVKTQFEREDLVLKLSCKEGTVDTITKECTLTVQVPGTFGVDSGRFVDDGYCFTNVYTWGDRVSAVEIVDVDNLLGYGAGFIAERYHDNDLPEANQGWMLWCEEGTQGGIDINKIGGYGQIPSGLYLRVKFKGVPATLATKVAINISWGKKS